jgi:pyridoxine 5-phosphate synthase
VCSSITEAPHCLAASIWDFLLCEQSGADSITLHLREDRRHIQDSDVEIFREQLTTKMNLEMAITDEMIAIASKIKPQDFLHLIERKHHTF